MKTSSSLRTKSVPKRNAFSETIEPRVIKRISRKTRFQSRSDGKINAINLIVGFMNMASKGLRTYQAWANEISSIAEKTLTRQAVEGRMNDTVGSMTEGVLKHALEKQLQKSCKMSIVMKPKWLKSIYVEDSTCVNLPETLSNHYPGNVSKGKKKAQFKIHALFNLTRNDFKFLETHSFRNNDQSLAARSKASLKKNDLLLRDLGFFSLEVIKKIIQKGIYLITRIKHRTAVYDAQTAEELNLVHRLRKNQFYDGEVLVGKKKKVKVRMVALRLPEKVAAERRRKQKNNRDRRLNRAKEYYELLGYLILITNISAKKCSAQQIARLYGLRWRIEIIFKTWKSGFSFEKIIPEKSENIHRIKAIINLMLLYILLFQTMYIKYVEQDQQKIEDGHYLSIMNLAKFFRQYFPDLILHKLSDHMENQLKKLCRYDKRNDRLNSIEKQLKWAA